MKQIILSLLLITYIAAIDLEKNYGEEFHNDQGYELVKPFWSVEVHSVTVDDMNIDRSNTINLGAGWIYKDTNKINMSYFYSKQELNATQNMKLDSFNIFYEHSFNNFGRQKGFYIGVGVGSNKYELSTTQIVTTENNDTNTTDTNTTVVRDGSQQIDLLGRIGYEHMIGKNFIVDISLNGTIYARGESVNLRKTYYAKFAVKYIFDIP